MFIDIHAHAYRIPGPPQDGHTTFCQPDQLLARYDEMGIERGVLLPLIGPEVYLPESNEEILEMAENSGGRFIPFCNIDPRAITNSASAPLDLWLRHYRDKGCRGVGEFMPNLPFLHPLVQNMFRHVQDVGMPLTFDTASSIGGTYGLYDDPGLPQLETCLQTFPNLKFFGHGPEFWAEMAALRTPADRCGYPNYPVTEEGVVPRLLRTYEHMYGDLSAGSGGNALMRDPDYAVVFINEFQDKLMYGTDICRFDQDMPLAQFLVDLRDEGKLSEMVFQKIARENAIRLLELDG
ncbi:MAG: amidohydrolase family protein [Lentisphaeria bacterium]|nr:amidohydrolase family protein [Lentisphaeria bacterium]